MKYLPVDLYKQFIYKNIPSIIMNIIGSIAIILTIYLKLNNVPIYYAIIIFIISFIINIINILLLTYFTKIFNNIKIIISIPIITIIFLLILLLIRIYVKRNINKLFKQIN